MTQQHCLVRCRHANLCTGFQEGLGNCMKSLCSLLHLQSLLPHPFSSPGSTFWWCSCFGYPPFFHCPYSHTYYWIIVTVNPLSDFRNKIKVPNKGWVCKAITQEIVFVIQEAPLPVAGVDLKVGLNPYHSRWRIFLRNLWLPGRSLYGQMESQSSTSQLGNILCWSCYRNDTI